MPGTELTATSTSAILPPPVTNELTVAKFNSTATNIAGTSTNLNASLNELEAELKKDMAGRKEYQDYLKTLEIKKKDLQKRVDENRAWIASFEKNNDSGAFEAQYKQLVDQISQIYNTAKEFHGKGIDMLIKDFDYHLAYKRWNDTFSAVPFKPK